MKGRSGIFRGLPTVGAGGVADAGASKDLAAVSSARSEEGMMVDGEVGDEEEAAVVNGDSAPAVLLEEISGEVGTVTGVSEMEDEDDELEAEDKEDVRDDGAMWSVEAEDPGEEDVDEDADDEVAEEEEEDEEEGEGLEMGAGEEVEEEDEGEEEEEEEGNEDEDDEEGEVVEVDAAVEESVDMGVAVLPSANAPVPVVVCVKNRSMCMLQS